jgi:membrane fusion protein (multidrug efflux system)
MVSSLYSIGRYVVVGVFCWMVVACGQAEGDSKKTGGGAPPTEVSTIQAAIKPLTVEKSFVGTLEPYRIAEIRARVAGVVQKRIFQEGGMVKAGQTLFYIEPDNYLASFDAAKASQDQAEAQVQQTKTIYESYQQLARVNAISQQDFLKAEVAFKQAEAALLVAKANSKKAKLSVDYAAVRSPISGFIGRSFVSEGALVGQNEATQLAVVQQTNPVYVSFSLSTMDALLLRKNMQKKSKHQQDVAVRLVLEDGSSYPTIGKVLFSEVSVDPNTGQVRVKAQVDNSDGLLLPGMFVRAWLQTQEIEKGILIPQQALNRGGVLGDTVMVVKADGSIETRPVQVAGVQKNDWVISSGLSEGDQVVVAGFQKIKGKDAKVKAIPLVDKSSVALANQAGQKTP